MNGVMHYLSILKSNSAKHTKNKKVIHAIALQN